MEITLCFCCSIRVWCPMSDSSCASFVFQTALYVHGKVAIRQVKHYLHTMSFFSSVLYSSHLSWNHILENLRELIKQSKNIKVMSATHANVEEETKRYLCQRLVHHRNARTFGISFIIFVCFLVTGLPQQIEFVLYTFGLVDPDVYFAEWLHVIYYLGVPAVNPLIYGTLDKRLFSFIKL